METDLDAQYERDLKNYCDHGDPGDDWCPEEVVAAMITWIRSNIEPDEPVLSVGCGNAMLLLQLHQHGFVDLTGIDRSAAAITLASTVVKDNAAKINLEVADMFASADKGSALKKCYKLMIDKGLIDMHNVLSDKKCGEKYLLRAKELVKNGGYLLVASSNNTEEELKDFFNNQTDGGFEVVSVVPTPTIEYAGKKGHDVTVLACRKKQ